LKGNFDCIVDSGDILPDAPNGEKEKAKWQFQWLEEHIEDYKQWLDEKPFLFTQGNHDHANSWEMEGLLNSNGIEAYCLHDKIVNHKSVNFYGFPYVNTINGNYAYETDSLQMIHKVDQMVRDINLRAYVDVIVAHAPPAGILDYSFRNKEAYGIKAMTDAFSYKIDKNRRPRLYCCGHVHQQGITMEYDMIFSNAAQSFHILEI
jgi:Icc-related predicted phosphoesterase